MPKWTRFASLLLCLTACAPASPLPPQSALQAQANPLEKEGQVVRLQLEIEPANRPELAGLPRTGTGMVQADGLAFRIAAAGRTLAEGKVEQNQIVLPEQALAGTQPPYNLSLQLPDQKQISTLIEQVLRGGELIRVSFRDAVIQSCTGQTCILVAGPVYAEARNVNAGGNVCVGICVNTPEPTPSPSPSRP